MVQVQIMQPLKYALRVGFTRATIYPNAHHTKRLCNPEWVI